MLHALGVNLEIELPGPQSRPIPSSNAGLSRFASCFDPNQIHLAHGCECSTAGEGGSGIARVAGRWRSPVSYLLGAQPAAGTGDSSERSPSAGQTATPRVTPSGQILAPPARLTRARTAQLRSLRLLPTSISLSKPLASQRLIVEGEFDDGHSEDLTSRAEVASSNLQVASVDRQSLVQAAGDGQATLQVKFGGLNASSQVTVQGFSTPMAWSFRSHVLPVMTKVGCNSGACHGAAAGKNGFKLTLRGYDPDADYYTLTHQALDRRVVRLEPPRA